MDRSTRRIKKGKKSKFTIQNTCLKCKCKFRPKEISKESQFCNKCEEKSAKAKETTEMKRVSTRGRQIRLPNRLANLKIFGEKTSRKRNKNNSKSNNDKSLVEMQKNTEQNSNDNITSKLCEVKLFDNKIIVCFRQSTE